MSAPTTESWARPLLSAAASHRVTRRDPHRSPPAWVGVGLLALLFLLAAEFGLAARLQNRTLAEYAASRDPVSGTLYLLMLGMFAAMPWLQTRRRHAGRIHRRIGVP